MLFPSNSTQVLSVFLANFFVWAFMMCTLLNFVRTTSVVYQSSIGKYAKEPFYLSSVMFISYALTMPMDYFLVSSNEPRLFLPFGIYITLDILTICVLLYFFKMQTSEGRLCKNYLLIGLALNTTLFIAMQLELLAISYEYKEAEQWWLWSLYGYGVNTIDAIMVLSLILHKDFIYWYKFFGKPLTNFYESNK